MDIVPYLSFNGSCREAMTFYAKLLGGDIKKMDTFEGSPMAENMPADSRHLILHAAIDIEGRRILASDTMPGQPETAQGMSVVLDFDDHAKGEAVFAALSEGGSVQMPFGPSFWAKGFGMVTDRFGIPWMVNVD